MASIVDNVLAYTDGEWAFWEKLVTYAMERPPVRSITDAFSQFFRILLCVSLFYLVPGADDGQTLCGDTVGLEAVAKL